VIYAESVNSFKIRLNKFWNNQDIIYDFRADYTEPEAEVKSYYNLCLISHHIVLIRRA